MSNDGISAPAEDLADRFQRTWNERDGSGYGTAYWPEAELVDPMGQVWSGREAIVQMHLDLWAGPFRGTKVLASVRRMRKMSPTVAVVDLDISGTGFPVPPGSPPDGRIAARLKHVIEQRDGEWKIAVSQNTFVAGPPRAE